MGFSALVRTARNGHLDKDLLQGGQMDAVLLGAAEAAAGEAREIAPVASGDYQNGIEAALVDGEGAKTARLNANDYKSHWIEWGTIYQAPKAVLRRGVLAAGLTFTEQPQ